MRAYYLVLIQRCDVSPGFVLPWRDAYLPESLLDCDILRDVYMQQRICRLGVQSLGELSAKEGGRRRSGKDPGISVDEGWVGRHADTG